ncbi:N-acetyltransferase [Glonium stellatum]|uniref:N-acetyltransferase n=1 Tax=Glonium stellatum TaxID=574774 RepID=A0A8E2JQP5_9PEZI|nr:N-acetyltransferase [Glonium stellatum]
MNDTNVFNIEHVRPAEDLSAIRVLFTAYAEFLGIDLTFQNFQSEMASMPGKYASPKGELLLARNVEGIPVGCVALRPIDPPGCCEMKRLYVAPEGRGLGLGKALVNAIIDVAMALGYREIRLDTLPSMRKAVAIYEKAGFMRIEPYYDTPLPGTRFLAKIITK